MCFNHCWPTIKLLCLIEFTLDMSKLICANDLQVKSMLRCDLTQVRHESWYLWIVWHIMHIWSKLCGALGAFIMSGWKIFWESFMTWWLISIEFSHQHIPLRWIHNKKKKNESSLLSIGKVKHQQPEHKHIATPEEEVVGWSCQQQQRWEQQCRSPLTGLPVFGQAEEEGWMKRTWCTN